MRGAAGWLAPLSWLGLALSLGACAAATAPGPGESRPEAAAPAPPPPPPPPSRVQFERLAAAHRERALTLEGAGRLRRALDEWRAARLIEPGDAVARAGEARLAARIETLGAERVSEARAALARGAHVEARRKLLAALAADPTNRAAFEMLQTQVHQIQFVSHTVRAGETLASIAQRYYGDRARSEVIWETNQLPPNTRLAAGTTLRIPEIPGLPFPGREAPPPPPVLGRAEPPAPAPSRPEGPRDEPPEHNPLLGDAREAIERSDFPTALADLDRLLASTPGNREALDLKKVALYRHGRALLAQKQYDESYRALSQLARLAPNYEDGGRLLGQARGRVVDRHYSEGIRLYREEKLPEAIAEWKVILEMEPQHANARRNIEQAERLLRGLDQRKKR